jgi:hypothetical protein
MFDLLLMLLTSLIRVPSADGAAAPKSIKIVLTTFAPNLLSIG